MGPAPSMATLVWRPGAGRINRMNRHPQRSSNAPAIGSTARGSGKHCRRHVHPFAEASPSGNCRRMKPGGKGGDGLSRTTSHPSARLRRIDGNPRPAVQRIEATIARTGPTASTTAENSWPRISRRLTGRVANARVQVRMEVAAANPRDLHPQTTPPPVPADPDAAIRSTRMSEGPCNRAASIVAVGRFTER